MSTFWIHMPICNQHFTTITIRKNKQPSWVEFRTDGIQQWTAGPLMDHLKSRTQKLHDSLMGLHACILYTGDTFAVLPHHDDYEAVKAFFEDESVEAFEKYKPV